MTAMLPLALLAPLSKQHARLYLRTCALGNLAFFPILFRSIESTFKIFSYVTHLAISVWMLERCLECSEVERPLPGLNIGSSLLRIAAREDCGQHTEFRTEISKMMRKESLLTTSDVMGMLIISVLSIFVEVIHPIAFKQVKNLEFLPLLVTSVICALGLIGCWIQTGILMLHSSNY